MSVPKPKEGRVKWHSRKDGTHGVGQWMDYDKAVYAAKLGNVKHVHLIHEVEER